MKNASVSIGIIFDLRSQTAADRPVSVHSLVFRSLKRTHDLFLANQNTPVLPDEKSYVLFCHSINIQGLFLFFQNRDEISRRIKAKDQYGTVLTLPKGMKPHVKNTAGTTDPTMEVIGMFQFICWTFFDSVFCNLDDGEHIDELMNINMKMNL